MPPPARPTVVGLGEVLWDLLPGGRVPGGAPANFAYHANALGARGVVVSAVGADEPGTELRSRLARAGLTTDYITVDPSHPTGTVSVELSPAGSPRFTIHQDVAWDHQRFTSAQRELARSADAVCFGTLAQRTPATASMVRSFLDASPERCLRVFDVNLRQTYYSQEVVLESLARASILKLNEDELPVMAGVLGLTGGEAEVLLRALLERFSLSLVALTRGAAGSLLLTPSGSSCIVPDPVPVVDTVGAGDAFTAALVRGVLHGLPLDRLHRIASDVASYVCTQPGATPSLPPHLASALVT